MSVTAPIPTRPLRPTYASRGAYCKRGRMEVALRNAGFGGTRLALASARDRASVAAAACKTLSDQDRRYRQPCYPFKCGFASE
jgi:hypothetical protein